ncbi:MAG TPA: PKD domain-containing protein [Acidimicrobiia bacterium]|nr:PKD domain-containing protein [Acidimicrobiia bacterium]
MGRSIRAGGAGLLVVIVAAGLLVGPAFAVRLRKESSSLTLGQPTVTCGPSPVVNLAWTDTQASATGTYRVMSLPANARQSDWVAGAWLGNVRSATFAAANGSSWSFAIEAQTSVTRDSNRVTVTVNCAVATPPSTPTNVTARAASCSRVDVAWTGSTDNSGTGLAGYNVYRGGVFVQRVTGTAWSDLTVSASSTYSYDVVAVDNAGDLSPHSAPAGVTTPACANLAPVANAGADQSALTLVTVSFNGSGSTDSDGSIASYSWNFGDGTTTTGVTVTHTYAHAGTYAVTLTVTDNLGATGTDTAIASIANRAPVANAGPDQTTTVGTAAPFNGSGSSDPDGTISAYSWSFGDGATATGVTTSHAYAAAGTYTTTLTVTDNNGATATDTAVVTVNTVANVPPIANAGADQSALTLTTLSFSGAGSSDPDGSIASYAWSFGDGASATGVSVSHSYATSGTYTVTLTVTDNKGATASDTAIATITNRPPVANAGADLSAQSLVSLTFNGSGSSDPDGSIASYAWNLGDGATATGSSVIHSYAHAGSYTVTLTVTDNKGATASDIAVATITNRPPIANAGPDQTALSLVSLSFNGSSSSDLDGTIASYAWNFGDGTTATGVSVSHSYAQAGSYVVTLTVTDNNGATAADTAVAMITNRPPTANAGPDQAGTVGTAVSFNGSGSSDPDGTIASYAWNFGDGTTASGVTVSHTFASAATFTATLTVTDNSGATGSDTATVTVSTSGGNQPPVANAGQDLTIQSLLILTFSSGGSFDPDGTIVAYNWNFGDGATATGPSPSHGYAHAGTYTVTLTVTDNQGATGSDTKIMTITNQAPTAFAGPDQNATVGVNWTFSGAQSIDRDGTIVNYAWNFGDGSTGSGVAPAHTYAAVGTYTQTLTVTDDLGATGSDTAVITVMSASSPTWARTAGGTDSDAATRVVTDTAGNMYALGQFHSVSMTVGTTTLTNHGGTDMFVVKYAPGGAVLWARDYGSTGDENAASIVLDNAGHFNVSGGFSGTANFGGSDLVAQGNPDMFLAQFNASDGSHVWSKRFGSAGNSDNMKDIAVDSANNIYATGNYMGTVNLGGANLSDPFTSDQDLFLAKFTSAGTHVWSKNFPNNATDIGTNVAVDGAGNVTVIGSLFNAINFSGNPVGGPGTLSSGGSLTDVVVAHFTTDGNYLWSFQKGSTTANETPGDLALDSAGNPVVSFFGTASFDLGSGTAPAAKGKSDVILAKYSASSGGYIWGQRYGGSGNDVANAITLDSADNVFLTGYFDSTSLSFGTPTISGSGSSTYGFIAKLDSAGNGVWARAYPGISNAPTVNLSSIAISAGYPVSVGNFAGTSQFDGWMESSAGTFDGVIVRTAP